MFFQYYHDIGDDDDLYDGDTVYDDDNDDYDDDGGNKVYSNCYNEYNFSNVHDFDNRINKVESSTDHHF